MSKILENKTDNELYEMLHQGGKPGRDAFDVLYARYSSKIFTYCKKILNNSDTAEDIFQETFVRFFESAKVERKMTNVAGFLIRIARNLCLNEKAKKYNDKVPLEDFQMPYLDNSYEKKELNDILNTALEALPEKFREVLILKEFMDLSYNEIAEALNTTLPVIRIRIYRARNKLREILQPYFEEYDK